MICGDDPILNGKGKPDPTIFLEAAKLLEIESEEARSGVLVFEDGCPGVIAARAAGMEGEFDYYLARSLNHWFHFSFPSSPMDYNASSTTC